MIQISCGLELGIPGDEDLLAVRRLASLSHRDHHSRRQRMIVEAVAPLLRSDPDLYLLLAGEGPDRAAVSARICMRERTEA